MSTDASILTALRAAGSGTVSGGDLAQKLGISRAAIWARIEDLRQLGYEIEASPHQGYRLMNSPDLLHADDLMSRLSGVKTIGRDVRVFQETTSTSDVADRLARDGVKEGMVVFAESQTKGRGRLGRSWWSAPGKGLWFSVLLRPNLRPPAATQLMVAAATALARAVDQQLQCHVEIKWPNDIQLGGKKLAGILTELNAELDHVRYIIVGIGLNVNHEVKEFPPDLRKQATSLRVELGAPVHRPELAAAILREFDHDYAQIQAGRFAVVADEWQRQCVTLGRQVRILVGDRTVQGRAEALDNEGALLLRTQHGRLERIIGGDVSVEK